MRSFVCIFLAAALLFSLAGCSFLEKEDAFDVEDCLEEVEELIEDGEYEEAEKLLKKGIRKADDPEKLEACLTIVQAMLDSRETTAAVEEATQPTTEDTQPTTEATQAAEAPTVPSTTPPTVPPATDHGPIRPSDLIMMGQFSKEQHYQLNIFLSNFSEQCFQSYPCGDYEMVNFGYKYAKINNWEVLGSDGAYYYVEKANMDSILTRFFGKTVSLSDPSTLTKHGQTIEYRGGVYYFPAADGESVAYCTAATNVLDQCDGTYLVYFDIYANVNPHDDMSPFYGMTAEQMSADSRLMYHGAGEAVVRNYTRSNGVESYQMISYTTYR